MKLSEIKKGLGGKGTLIGIDTGSHEVIAYRRKDFQYDDLYLYCFEEFVGRTFSPVAKFLCEKYGVERLFAFKEYEDDDVQFMVAVPKSVSDSIPANEGELIKEL